MWESITRSHHERIKMTKEVENTEQNTPEVLENTEIVEQAPAETAEEVATETAEENMAETAETTTEQTFAKAGKRSKKVIEETAAEEARQARKEEVKTDEVKKGPAPISRPKIERRGKKYQESAKLVEKGKIYSLKDGLDLAIKTSNTKFDATIEVHTRLNVDPAHADQNIRSTVVLPNGTGKTIKVAVFAPAADAKIAKAAGADIAEDEEFLARLDKGTFDFDILITTPAYMPKLGKYARALGPKGLMPNPKTGTVTTDIEKAVKETKAGKVEYRVDKQSIVHIGIGKVSFGTEKLLENADVFFANLKSQKPSTIKGQFVKSVYLTTTMGPSIQIENLYN